MESCAWFASMVPLSFPRSMSLVIASSGVVTLLQIDDSVSKNGVEVEL